MVAPLSPAGRAPVPAGRLDRYYPWLVVLASLVMIVVGQGVMFVLSVLLKPITLEMGWPREVPSFAYACAFFGGGIGALYVGHLSDRFGMGPVSLLGAISIPTGALLAGYVTEPWQLYLVFGVLIGLAGNATIFAPLMANLTRWFSRNRGIALGIASSGQSLGGTIWPPIVDRLHATIGWRGVFFWYAIMAVVVMLAMTLVLRRRAPGHAAGSPNPAPRWSGYDVLGWPAWLVQALLCVAIFCCCVPMSLPLVHLVAHVTDIGFSGTQAAQLLSLALLTSFISRVGGGALADRIGGLRTLMIGSTIQCAMLALLSVTRDLASLYIVCVIFGLGYGGIIAMYAFIIREFFPPEGIGRRVSVNYLFGTLGMALGGWLGGLVYDQLGSYSPAFQVVVLINLVNLAIVGTLIWRTRVSPRMVATA